MLLDTQRKGKVILSRAWVRGGIDLLRASVLEMLTLKLLYLQRVLSSANREGKLSGGRVIIKEAIIFVKG